jgi:hypothetical protein
LPISVFCRERGVPASSLFAWRRRLESGAARRPMLSPAGDGEVFKPVKLVSEPQARRPRRTDDVHDADAAATAELSAAGCGGVELHLPGRRRLVVLVVRRGFDRQLLLDVVGALESLT